MITLLTFPPALDCFAASPFCTKARHLLHMSGQDWERENVDNPSKLPYGKLPAIRVEGQIIADSANIRAFLEDKGADFDPGLTQKEKAASHALTRMLEEHVYFVILLDRWADSSAWPAIKKTYFKSVPAPLRGLIAGSVRRSTLKGMQAQGLGRMSAMDRLARVEPDLQVLISCLQDQSFLMGDQITSVDLTAVAMLEAAMATPAKTDLQQRVEADHVLSGYVSRTNAALKMA